MRRMSKSDGKRPCQVGHDVASVAEAGRGGQQVAKAAWQVAAAMINVGDGIIHSLRYQRPVLQQKRRQRMSRFRASALSALLQDDRNGPKDGRCPLPNGSATAVTAQRMQELRSERAHLLAAYSRLSSCECVRRKSAAALAAWRWARRWQAESAHGISGTGIRTLA